MSKYIIIDNKEYKVPIVEFKRSADILDLTASRNEKGVLVRKVIGTFYNCTLNIGVINDFDLYEELWDVLTAPVASHKIELPHDHVRFEGYFSSVSDDIVLITDDGYKAKGLTCKITMTKPARRP